MSQNIDLLLDKLNKDSLAYELVNLLKRTPKNIWTQTLEKKLIEVFQERKKEIIDAHNQDSKD